MARYFCFLLIILSMLLTGCGLNNDNNSSYTPETKNYEPTTKETESIRTMMETSRKQQTQIIRKEVSPQIGLSTIRAQQINRAKLEEQIRIEAERNNQQTKAMLERIRVQSLDACISLANLRLRPIGEDPLVYTLEKQNIILECQAKYGK